MLKIKASLILLLILVAVFLAADYVSATPSQGFREVNDHVFDDWDIARTRAAGQDGFYQISETGFRPVIVFEGLGEEAGPAYSLGEQFAQQNQDPVRRAEAIFRFVRDRVKYTPDKDQFQYDEFAQNADEVAMTIEQDGVAYGDCEDSAVLLAVMYQGAGYRCDIAVAPGHAAALVYLPEHQKAAFELEEEPGWVWAEATGKNNPLGWAPKEFIDEEMAAYEVSAEAIGPGMPSAAPLVSVGGGGGSSTFPFPFFGFFIFFWLLSLFRRRHPR
jgi:hypothetical protein